MKDPPSPEEKASRIISPPKSDFPPQKPMTAKLLDACTGQPYLPPREYCNHYVTRFFEEVHCIYWLFPIEQFHARLDETYASTGDAVSSSWLCALYSICALGAASESGPVKLPFDDLVPEELQRYPDAKSSNDYLALAKALVPAVHDEADLDSIRALAILVSSIRPVIIS